MSIADEITRIRTAKEDLKTAINAKGGSLADETLDNYAQAVTALPEAGTDTSDATATEEDIRRGYTAYVKGEKITGIHLCKCESYDLSTATATAADILEGKTAFAGTGRITGTIPVQAGYVPVLTPGQSYYLSSGYYASKIEVKAVPLNIDPENIRDGFWETGLSKPGSFTRDATATAADILKGKTAGIKGEMVTGTLVPSTGSTFYKCASVDTTAKTWSGYKAVLTDGVYSFEETATTGLTFGAGFAPAVGTIYSADTLARVDQLFEGAGTVPGNGLIFYLPFNGNAEPVEGEVTSMTGELTYGEANGIGYAVFDGSQASQMALGTLPEAMTVALSFCVSSTDSVNRYMFHIPKDSASNTSTCGLVMNGYNINFPYQAVELIGSHEIDTWRSFVGIYSNGTWNAYLNGTKVLSDYAFDPIIYGFTIGGMINGSNMFTGKLADFAVWNRVLTAEEIAQVAARAASMN